MKEKEKGAFVVDSPICLLNTGDIRASRAEKKRRQTTKHNAEWIKEPLEPRTPCDVLKYTFFAPLFFFAGGCKHGAKSASSWGCMCSPDGLVLVVSLQWVTWCCQKEPCPPPSPPSWGSSPAPGSSTSAVSTTHTLSRDLFTSPPMSLLQMMKWHFSNCIYQYVSKNPLSSKPCSHIWEIFPIFCEGFAYF